MMGGALALTINDGMAKYLTETYPVGQVMAIRGTSILVLLAVFILVSRNRITVKINSWRNNLYRGLAMTGSTFCFITGLSLLPIADAIAIAFAAPLLTTILAVFFLKERVGWHRWVAIFFGFVGVIIIVQPTGDAFKLVALAPLGAAFFGAIRDVITRKITNSESSLTILITSMFLITLLGYATYPLGWSEIQIKHLWLFLGSSVLVGLAQYLMIEAFRLGEVGLISPFKYSSLIWAIIIGFVVWGDIPNYLVLIGSVVVVLSGIYLLRGERIAKNNS
ncbi:MAG: DMT family transporter [Rhodospirillaceae bacterium]|nr:DMT family transporter [Rhodospirillaceae bacterium]MBT6305409.1 DMT family transporter [Rhodospirillaceae bacterium]